MAITLTEAIQVAAAWETIALALLHKLGGETTLTPGFYLLNPRVSFEVSPDGSITLRLFIAPTGEKERLN